MTTPKKTTKKTPAKKKPVKKPTQKKATRCTPKQEAFSVDYAIHESSSRAYRAHYDVSGCTSKTVSEMASRLLASPVVRARVDELLAMKKEVADQQFKIDAKYVLKRHVEIDQLDIMDIISDDMDGLLPLSSWPPEWRRSVVGMDVSDIFEYIEGSKNVIGLLKKIKLPDKLRNLELLGKHVDVQAYKEKVEVDAPVENRVIVIPGCTSVEDWEKQASGNQEKNTKANDED